MEKSIDYEFTGEYVQLDNDGEFFLTISTQTLLSNISKEKYILFILDISGSMSGSILNNCIITLKNMLTYLHQDLKNTNIDLILFNNDTKFINMKNKMLDECVRIVSTIQAQGGTSFIPVFKRIDELLDTFNKEEEACIILLSDGQAEKIEQLKNSMDLIREKIIKRSVSVEFHTLGFGVDHDAKLLNAFISLGSVPGSFQYIKQANDIDIAIEKVSGFFNQKSTVAKLKNRNFEKRINFKRINTETDGNNHLYEAPIYIESSFKDFIERLKEFEIILENDQEDKRIKVEFMKKLPSELDSIKIDLEFMNQKLRNFTKQLTSEKIAKEIGEEILLTISKYKIKLAENTKKVFKLKIPNRGIILDDIKDLTEYLTTFQSLIKDNFINQLSNDQIATLNSLAYRDVTKKALLKKLDKRAIKSVPILNEAFEKVRTISSNLDAATLNSKFEKELEIYGDCVLSCNNFIEAMMDEDCLCVTFDIIRSEQAITDATKVTIKEIYPTIISAKSFLDSAKYAIKIDALASGGFGDSGSLIKGISSENITGALPIFICKEHWDIASLLMKPILGYNICLDPVGYYYGQKKIFPFILLSKALRYQKENPLSDYYKRLSTTILDTCTQIIKDDMEPDFDGTLKQDVLECFNNYIKDGAVRTRDKIACNDVFLSQVYCFNKLGLIQDISNSDFVELLKIMAEEELRRRQEELSFDSEQMVIELLDIKIKKYVEILKQSYVSDEQKFIKDSNAIDYELIFLSQLNNKLPMKLTDKERKKIDENPERLKIVPNNPTNPEKERKINDIILEVETKDLDWDPKLSELSKTQMKAFEAYEKLYKSIHQSLFIWLNYFYPEDKNILDKWDSLEKIGINSTQKFLCLFIQNLFHIKSSDRRYSFESNTHADPFSQEESILYLEKQYKKIILSKYQSEIRQPTKEIDDNVISIFAKTDSLEEAAGILLNGIDLYFYQSLQFFLKNNTSSCKLVFDKLQMLRNKNYRGVEFKMNFDVRRRFVRKLKKKFPEYSYNKWREIWYCKT